jgi:hypothetical protein
MKMRNKKLFWLAFGALLLNLLLSIVSYCYAATIQVVSFRQNATDQTIGLTITDDQENVYKWAADIPLGVDPQAYVDQRIDQYLLEVRRQEYPDAPRNVTGSLEDMRKWIQEGCIIPAEFKTVVSEAEPLTEGAEPTFYTETVMVSPEEVAEKKPWTGKHPELSLKAKIEALEAENAALQAEKTSILQRLDALESK